MARPHDLKSNKKSEPLVVSRTFPAPRDLVFKAWSSAEHIKRWFCPEGCSVPEAEVDFRPAACLRSALVAVGCNRIGKDNCMARHGR
jgi:uncharacterized protein YndB with AHSA1/START domain